jgi:hypothetical protein
MFFFTELKVTNVTEVENFEVMFAICQGNWIYISGNYIQKLVAILYNYFSVHRLENFKGNGCLSSSKFLFGGRLVLIGKFDIHPKQVGFEVLTVVIVKSTVFWNLRLYCTIEIHEHFGGTCCLHHLGWKVRKTRIRQQAKPEGPEDGDSMFLSNISELLNNMVLHQRRQYSPS